MYVWVPNRGLKGGVYATPPAYRPNTKLKDTVSIFWAILLNHSVVKKDHMPAGCSLRAERETAGKLGPTGATTPLRMWHPNGPDMSCISSSFEKSSFCGTVQHFSPLGVVLLLGGVPPAETVDQGSANGR